MWWQSRSAIELSAIFAVSGSILAIGVPAFFRNLSFSMLSEPMEGLDRMVRHAVTYAGVHPQEIAFPPSVPLTPAQVPRGTRNVDPQDAWEPLTWRSLEFRFEEPHAFAFQFDSERDPGTQAFRFTATAHGDLDGDGILSTFEVRGEKLPGQPPRVLPGMFIDREVE